MSRFLILYRVIFVAANVEIKKKGNCISYDRKGKYCAYIFSTFVEQHLPCTIQSRDVQFGHGEGAILVSEIFEGVLDNFHLKCVSAVFKMKNNL